MMLFWLCTLLCQDPATASVEQANPLLAKIQQQQYPRTPEQVLRARVDFLLGQGAAEAVELPADADQTQRREAEAQREATRFRSLVMAGEWPRVGAFLTAHDAIAAEVFQHLLERLVSGDHTLMPQEVLEVAALCPSVLDEDQLALIGSLLRSAAERGSVAGLADWIRQGHPQFGSQDEASRRRTATLLFDAGLVAAAESFLPSLAADEQDPKILVQFARVHQDLGLASPVRADRELHLQRAFELYRRGLDAPEADHEFRARTLGMVLALLPELPEGESATWRRALFEGGGAFGLSALVEACQQAREQKRISSRGQERAKILAEIAAMAELMVAATGPQQRDATRRSLNLVTEVLLDEAEFTLGADPNDYQYKRYDQQTRSYYPTFVAAADIAESMPSQEWMDLLDQGLGERVLDLRIRLAAATLDPDRALELIREARMKRPGLAQQLAETFLSSWTRALEEQRQLGVDDPRVVMPPSDGYGSSVPLTRAHQMRALAHLAELLRAFSELGIEAMAPSKLVEGFAACHSSAEVYRREDIEALLGPIEAMPAEMAVALADNMRRNLATRWQSQRVQEAAGTRRSKAQVEAEVARGYALAQQVLERAVSLDPDAWLTVLTQAALTFDFAEFTHARDPNLLDYTPLRDGAFRAFAAAAEAYRQELVARRAVPTVLPYVLWFASSLGASELGFLTRTTRPDHDQVAQIRQAIVALPDSERPLHWQMFADWVAAAAVPPQVKPRFLKHAARVLGEQASGAAIRDRLRLYEELVDEVRLVAEIDGSAQVGGDRPFGVRLSLRYTTALEREAGGFDKYLQNGVYAPGNSAPVDYRDEFEEQIRSTLTDAFEVENLIFHRPEVAPRGFGLHGWMEKPLAYLVVRARDSAVDRIPSIQMDMDFSDGSGIVLLPLTSPVVLLDADPAHAEDRPYQRLEIEQVLDARGLADGNLGLEVRARGRGILPELGSLIPDWQRLPGWECVETLAHPINLIELDAKSDPVMPLTERSWSLQLRPAAEASASFAFPAIAVAHDALTLRRYADLDVVDADPVVVLDPAWFESGGPPAWLVGLALLVLLGGAVWIWVRREPEAVATVDPLAVPWRATPLTTLRFLERLEEDPDLPLDPAHRMALHEERIALERRCFSAEENLPDRQELTSVVERWAAQCRA